MSDLTVSPDLLRGPATPGVTTGGSTERMRETAQRFEASFLAEMLKPMFEGLSTEAPFGGGDAEATWRSFMVEAMAKQTAKAGGVGLADHVLGEMIRMQEQGA